MAHISPPPSGHRFPNGQTYVFSVEWHLFTAGTATVRMDTTGSEQKVTAIADSLGAANLLYGVHDHFEARFDPATFCSTLVAKQTEEGSHRRDTQVHFDYGRRKSVLNEKNLKTGESKQVENDIPPCVTDVVTGFYYLASLPLKMGESYAFPVSDGGKSTLATIEQGLGLPCLANACTASALSVFGNVPPSPSVGVRPARRRQHRGRHGHRLGHRRRDRRGH